MIKWQTSSGAVRTLGGGPQSHHGCSALRVCTASCTFIAPLCVLNLAGHVILHPPPPQKCLRSISPMMLGPSASCLLTVFRGLENLAVACRSELQLLMCGVCDIQWAAVLQHRPAEVRGDRWVHTASLRPEGRDWKEGGGGIGINEWINCTWGWYCRCSAQLTMQTACVDSTAGRWWGEPALCSPPSYTSPSSLHPAHNAHWESAQHLEPERERERANGNSCKALDFFLGSSKNETRKKIRNVREGDKERGPVEKKRPLWSKIVIVICAHMIVRRHDFVSVSHLCFRCFLWLTLFSLPRHHRAPEAPLSHAGPGPHPGFIPATREQQLFL